MHHRVKQGMWKPSEKSMSTHSTIILISWLFHALFSVVCLFVSNFQHSSLYFLPAIMISLYLWANAFTYKYHVTRTHLDPHHAGNLTRPNMAWNVFQVRTE